MKVIIDLKLENWNEIINNCRTNRFGANNHKKKEMQQIGWFIRNMPKISKYPVKINCIWHIKNSNSDLDNCSIKAVLDCMQHLGILENDNIKHISSILYTAIKDTKDFLEIEIIEPQN